MVQAQVGYDPVNPGVKRAFKPEIANMPISFEKGFLIDVMGVSVRSGQVHGQAQDGLIILAHQCLESCAVSALRGTYQLTVVNST
jgi:hypothetical protein